MATKITLPTIWHIPDDLWSQIRPLLGPEKPAGTRGRPPVPYRRVLDGILYVLRTGGQWKKAPREFGSGSVLHRRFQQWVQAGIFQKLWRRRLKRYAQRHGIAWRWQALDTVMTKAPLGGAATGPNPTDRAKCGTKRHVLSDGRGVPLAVYVTGANTHDQKGLLATLDQLLVPRPAPRPYYPQHLCLDKGYDDDQIRQDLGARNYVYHIKKRKKRGQPPPPPFHGKRRHPARRWVIERTHSWHNRYRRLLVRWEKKVENYRAFIHLACALTVYRLTLILG